MEKGQGLIQSGIKHYDSIGAQTGDPEMSNRNLAYIAESFGWFAARIGSEPLAKFLEENGRTPLHKMDNLVLKKWVQSFYSRKYDSDAMFRQNCLIKAIKANHVAERQQSSDRIYAAKVAYEASPTASQIQEFEAKVDKVNKTYDGLAKFLQKDAGENSTKAASVLVKLGLSS